MKFEFTSVVVYYISTKWMYTKSGFIHKVTDLSGTLIKVGFCYISVFIKCYLFTSEVETKVILMVEDYPAMSQ